MKDAQQAVATFMSKAGQNVSNLPHIPVEQQLILGVKLIEEEVDELRTAAYLHKDIVGIYDALCDIIYVTLWLANAAGLDMEAGFNEVHRSNLSKFIDGYRDEKTGKWKKGKSYSPPNLSELVAKQIIEASQDTQEK